MKVDVRSTMASEMKIAGSVVEAGDGDALRGRLLDMLSPSCEGREGLLLVTHRLNSRLMAEKRGLSSAYYWIPCPFSPLHTPSFHLAWISTHKSFYKREHLAPEIDSDRASDYEPGARVIHWSCRRGSHNNHQQH